MEFQYILINDAEILKQSNANLESIYYESKQHIKRRRYRKAYRQLDGYFIKYNIFYQISIFDRIQIRKRLIYCLCSIFYDSINKINYQDKQNKIIERLSNLLYEQFLDLTFFIRQQLLCHCEPGDEKVYIQQSLNETQQTEGNIESYYKISVKKSIMVNFQVPHFYSILSKVIRLIAHMYRHRRLFRLSTEYVQFGDKIFRHKIDIIQDQFRYILSGSQNSLSTSVHWYELGFIQIAKNGLLFCETYLPLLINQGILIKQTTPKNNMIKKYFQSVIKLYIKYLLQYSLCASGLHEYQYVRDSIGQSVWISKLFINDAYNIFNVYITHYQKQFLIPAIEALKFSQDMHHLVLFVFGQEHSIFQRIRIRQEQFNNQQDEQKLPSSNLFNRFNELAYQRFQYKELNQNGVIIIEPVSYKYQPSKANRSMLKFLDELKTPQQIKSEPDEGNKHFKIKQVKVQKQFNTTLNNSDRQINSSQTSPSKSFKVRDISPVSFRNERDINIAVDQSPPLTHDKKVFHKLFMGKEKGKISRQDILEQQFSSVKVGSIRTIPKREYVVNDEEDQYSEINYYTNIWRRIILKHKYLFPLKNFRVNANYRLKKSKNIIRQKLQIRRKAVDQVNLKLQLYLALIEEEKDSKKVLKESLQKSKQVNQRVLEQYENQLTNKEPMKNQKDQQYLQYFNQILSKFQFYQDCQQLSKSVKNQKQDILSFVKGIKNIVKKI